ncbi:MAG TPA: transposase [Puia sp.]|nr:transposase [Puia sp.]
MGSQYKIGDNEIPHFISFSVVNWIDALTRNEYKDIIVDSLQFCMSEKGMVLNAWVIMSNHLHLIMSARAGVLISNILRDMKKYTSKQIIKAIKENPKESRKDWMIWMFERAGKRNSNNEIFQFWQQDNHPVELSSNEMIEQRLNYMHENPVRAGIVYEPQDYVYSSAIDYYTTMNGRIAVEHL